MASTTALLSVILLLLTVTAAVKDDELTVMYGVMRAFGFDLFADAIATSDLRGDLKSDGNFTLLAPPNSALHALNITMPDVTTLRYHVIPRRMSMIDLLSLSTSAVPTLVPGRDIHVEQSRSVRSLITIEGVEIVVPGMHYGRTIALHGLADVLDKTDNHSNRGSNRASDHSVNNTSAPAPYEAKPGHTNARFIAFLTVFMVFLVLAFITVCIVLAMWLREQRNKRKVRDDRGDVQLN